MSDLLDEAYGYSDDSPKCGACGKKMLDHPGLRETCKLLEAARKRIKELEDARDWYDFGGESDK